MNCPACGRCLSEKTAGNVTVDVCDKGCGGIWFDKDELQRLDDADESTGVVLLDVPRDPSLTINLDERRRCPRCEKIVMMRHFYSPRRTVVVDQCANCGGYWLDAGELAQIRSEFKTEAERERAFKESYERDVGIAIREQQASDAAASRNTTRLAGIFRFIAPSNYFGKRQG